MTENRTGCELLRELVDLLNNNGEKLYDIHFGNLIKYQLQREGRSVNWFALQMNSDRSNMYKLLNRSHLDSSFLIRASILLGHDFFRDATEYLKTLNGNDGDLGHDDK